MSFLWHGLTEQGAQVPVQVDAQGRVIAVDGTPAGTNYWNRTGTTLSPVNAGDSVEIGGNVTQTSSGTQIYRSENGQVILRKLSLYSPGGNSSTDPGVEFTHGEVEGYATVVTNLGSGAFAIKSNASGAARLYFKSVGNTDENVQVWRHSKDLRLSASGGEVLIDQTTKIGGTLPLAPNITLNANGSASFAPGSDKNLKTDIVAVGTGGGIVTGIVEVHGDRAQTSSAFSVRPTDASSEPSAIISTNGSATFASDVKIGGTLPSAPNISLNADGSATFAGNITAPNVTFRSADPQFYVKKSKNKDALPEYVGPELDLLAEIARLEALVRHLYETLRLAPPAGWPVWDGNDVLRQLRK